MQSETSAYARKMPCRVNLSLLLFCDLPLLDLNKEVKHSMAIVMGKVFIN